MEKIFIIPEHNGSNSSVFSVGLAGITYPDTNYKIYRKCSQIYVAEYVCDGEGTVICDGSEYHIKKGDAYILPKNKEHIYFSDKSNPWTKKWFNISGTLCEKLLSAYGIENNIYFKDNYIEGLFDEFFDFCEKNTDAAAINEFGAVIFHRIVQCLTSSREKGILSDAYKIKRYIDRNIYEKLSAAEVAESLGFSVSQLGRIFKSEFGTTVYSYILDQKIKTAKNLLRNSGLSIKEISYMLKFTDEHYFCNVFKQKCSVTPSKYRR